MRGSEGHKCCCCCSPLLVSGIIFALIALAHLLRIILGWNVVFIGHEVPMWASIVTIVIGAAMAIWNFCGCWKCKKGMCHRQPPA